MRAALLLLALRWCAAPPAAAALSNAGPRSRADLGDRWPLFRAAAGRLARGWAGGRPEAPALAAARGAQRAVSTVDNTAVYMATSHLSGVKLMVLKELARVSPYHIVVGYDVKAKASVPANVEGMLRMSGGDAREITIVPASMPAMVEKYGDKISNYSGVYQDNPAKIAVMDWFASSNYDYLWHVEDDTWARGFDRLALEVASRETDLIIKNATFLPFWADASSSWRVGDRAKLPTGSFVHCLPALFRMSKRFAQSVLREILDSEKTNHHEVWWPHVVQKANLSWEPLPFADNLHFNVAHDSAHNESPLCMEDLRMNESLWLVHPIKCIHHGLRGE